VFTQQAEQFSAIQKRDGLVIRKCISICSIRTSRNKDPPRSSFLANYGAQISYGANVNSVRVTLRLDNVFTSVDGVWIECDRVHPAVSARLSDFYFGASSGELLFEQFSD